MPGQFRVPLDELLFPPPVPAGMNPLVLMSLAYAMKTDHEPAGKPIRVTREGAYWRIRRGRHRAMAAMIAGRAWIWARE